MDNEDKRYPEYFRSTDNGYAILKSRFGIRLLGYARRLKAGTGNECEVVLKAGTSDLLLIPLAYPNTWIPNRNFTIASSYTNTYKVKW
jgi:hypothetical protein